MSKICSSRNIEKIKERFFNKYHLTEDDGRVYCENGKVKKEVWMHGKGWTSESAFKRYMNLGKP